MKLAPHLHRLGNDIVASYLIDLPEGVTLIDAGLPGHWKDLHSELAAIGRSLSDVRGVILTHGDSDHIGFAERLRQEAGVPVFIHEADEERARTGRKPKTGGERMALAGVVSFFTYALGKGGLRTKYVQEMSVVADGDVLDLPGSPVIVGIPGHSPGSIAVHVPAVDALFVGDALTTRHVLTGELGPQAAPFTDDPAGADASLDRLKNLSASWVLPGHGEAWQGSPAVLVDALRAR